MLVRKNKFTINPGLVEFTPSMKSVQDEIDSILSLIFGHMTCLTIMSG